MKKDDITIKRTENKLAYEKPELIIIDLEEKNIFATCKYDTQEGCDEGREAPGCNS